MTPEVKKGHLLSRKLVDTELSDKYMGLYGLEGRGLLLND